MIKRLYILLAVAVATTSLANGQTSTSAEGYYRNPMDIPMVLSANFGEMRTNHFHSGIDIKTKGVEGQRIYSVADGYVARASVTPGGFGFSLYIAHPNGTTSVYAHMQRFAPHIEKQVNDWRYANKKHAGDIYFKTTQYPVKKGDYIGLSGNSGISGGPHLHFEIRETASQNTINTIARKIYTTADNIAPRIVRLYMVQTDTVATVPKNETPKEIEIRQNSTGKYSVASLEPITIPLQCYFLVEVTDRKNDIQNSFGVYRIEEIVDQERVFEIKLDKFSFANTRYKNSVSYYPLQRSSANEVFRLTKMEGNKIPLYGTTKSNGILTSNYGQNRDILIEVVDDSGNVSTLSFKAKAILSIDKTEKTEPLRPNMPIVYYNRDFNSRSNGIAISIPAGSLYESMFFWQEVAGADSPLYKIASAKRPIYSPIYTVLSEDVPLQTAMKVSIETNDPEKLRSKLTLGSIGANGTISYVGGAWSEGVVSANVRSFGRFCVVADTVAPQITPLFFSGANLGKATQISFTLTDDFSGIDNFSGTIDGKWILFERDTPKKRITHNFDRVRFDYTATTHKIEVVATDNKGNKTMWSGTFVK